MDAFLKWFWDNAQTLEALAALTIIPLLWLFGKIFLREKGNSSSDGGSRSTNTFHGPVQINGDFVARDKNVHGEKNA